MMVSPALRSGASRATCQFDKLTRRAGKPYPHLAPPVTKPEGGSTETSGLPHVGQAAWPHRRRRPMTGHHTRAEPKHLQNAFFHFTSPSCFLFAY